MRGLLKCALALAALGVACFGAAAAQTPSPPPIDRARFAAFVDGAVSEAQHSRRIPGVSVAAIDRQGLILARGYGEAAPDRAADADTLFRVGSISKTAVWIAIMQLVEQGKLTPTIR